jgi:hypothetical protein
MVPALRFDRHDPASDEAKLASADEKRFKGHAESGIYSGDLRCGESTMK